MNSELVTFFFPEFFKNYDIESLDLDNHSFFSSWDDLTIRAWIVQTYLRLKKLGCNVDISDKFPTSGVVVLLSNKDSLSSLDDSFKSIPKDVIIVTIRADELQWRPMLSDVEVVQNGLFANNKDCFFIPHWPQPGIIKRESSRGNTIKNIVFKGGRGSLESVFYSDSWIDGLKARDIDFKFNTEHTNTNWMDYSDSDLTLAVRPLFNDKYQRSDKPASKLVNSWFAEVPALLGPEYSFKELRKSDLDYIEVTTVQNALSEIDRLKDDKNLYDQMVQNGIKRSQDFTADATVLKWKWLLFDYVPSIRDEIFFKRSRIFNRDSRVIYHFLTKKQTLFEHKRRFGSYYRSLTQTK
ncbi:glycosyltransferase family 1 protein [Algoriphagus chordae]|uniref:Glycosyl transferase family 1 n=1 Tax=Algoriphagus chordae TaxID=237019 RepID=A0A2W7R8S9_9BACT|nr:glycosyltransferase family 1 protein [Algoriphagus chordae]PZX52087.1 hypothetical protein LV85_02237 [Algoriphagus chordae]